MNFFFHPLGIRLDPFKMTNRGFNKSKNNSVKCITFYESKIPYSYYNIICLKNTLSRH